MSDAAHIIRLAAQRITLDAEWNEAQHKRDHGKFSSGGGGSGAKGADVKAKPKTPRAKPAGNDWKAVFSNRSAEHNDTMAKQHPGREHFEKAAASHRAAAAAYTAGKVKEARQHTKEAAAHHQAGYAVPW